MMRRACSEERLRRCVEELPDGASIDIAMIIISISNASGPKATVRNRIEKGER